MLYSKQRFKVLVRTNEKTNFSAKFHKEREKTIL